SPDVVFAQVNDFHRWDAWSPWKDLDPAAKTAFEGPASGAGAIYTWSGNDQIGVGRMTIVGSHPTDRVDIKLEFVRPRAGTSDVRSRSGPQGPATAVTWTMSGTNDFVGKAFCLVMNMDRMIGGDFEKGLSRMKAAAEGAAK